MDRNQAKALLPIIQAYAEGKAIESRCIKGDKSLWYDDEDPSFDDDFEYRIKPEPKYRPFKDSEECWNEMQKHQPFGWTKLIGAIEYSFITDVDDNINYSDAIKEYTFADGTPFGIREAQVAPTDEFIKDILGIKEK